LVLAEDERGLEAGGILHIDVTLDGGEEAALLLGATAALPCLVRYQANEPSSLAATVWVLENVGSEAEVLEFVRTANIDVVPSATLELPLPAAGDAEATPAPPAATEALSASTVPSAHLDQQHAVIRSVADAGGCVRIFVAGERVT
jgi:hypothetical protein